MSVQQGGRLQPQNLWDRAVETLSTDDRALIDFNDPDRIAVLEGTLALAEDKKRQCLTQRWKIRRSHGRNLILRDVFGKIIVWVQKFKEIGDIAVQYDSAHATLPWAGVRLLLEITIKESQIFGAMIEGLEIIASLLPRYAVFEDIYLREPSIAMERLKDSLIMLYSATLTFLSKTIHYFRRSTVKRMALSIVTLTDTNVDTMTRDIDALQRNVDRDAQLVSAERQQSMLQGITQLSSSLANWRVSTNMNLSAQSPTLLDRDFQMRTNSLLQLLGTMKQPLSRMADRLVKLHDNLAQEERLNIFRWLSTIPYSQHHENMRKGRLHDSGLWLLDHPDFQKWSLDSYSSILWVHGSPGSGKSKLMSVVIDDTLKRNDAEPYAAPMAYFYCARDVAEPERADPEKVLLSIARQLSGTDITKPLCEATIQRHARFRKAGLDARSLSVDETVDLILDLLFDTPATIVIDALDECDPARRHELLDSLDAIIQKSANMVKILVSSRDDGDILCRLETSPNLYISAKYNAGDIGRFIRHEVLLAIGKKRLLSGRVPDYLKNLIIDTLEAGSQGMFRWVSLQLQNLCDSRRIKVEEDLLEELGRLPKTLLDLYDRIYEEVLRSAKHSRSIGIRVLKWLRVAQRTLTIPEILGAVSTTDDGTTTQVTTRDILNMTCNLVVEDTAVGCLRYAHLSVQEYLDSRPEFSDDETHRVVAERCLEAYTVYYPKDPLSQYAMFHWPTHHASMGPRARGVSLYTSLLHFLFQGSNSSPYFHHWRNDIDNKIGQKKSYTVEEVYGSNSIFMYTQKPGSLNEWSWIRSSNAEDYRKIDLQAATTPFFTACIYGLREVLEVQARRQAISFKAQLSEFCQVPGTQYRGYNGLHIAILSRHFDLVDFLLRNGLDTSICTKKGETPLHIAARRQSATMVELLLRCGADPNAISYIREDDTKDHRPGEPRGNPSSAQGRELGIRSSLGFRQTSGRVVSVIDEDAEAPIHLAAREGDTRCLSTLLKHGASVDMKTTLGSTALHTALLGGKNDIIKILLEAGANVNSVLMYGRTPLHLAAASGNINVMALLLQYGADPHQRDDSGNSAIEVARRYGHVAAVEVLRPSLGPEGKLFQPQVPSVFTGSNFSSVHPVTIPHRPSFEAQLRADAKEDRAVFKLAVQDHCDTIAVNTGHETANTAKQHAFDYFD